MQEDKYVYIASPFFDEKSVKYVENREQVLKGTKTKYFSPREDGIKFGDVEDLDLRSDTIKAIFANNVKYLKECNSMHANVNYCNGRLDSGTIWEIGYFIGYHSDIVEFKLFGPNEIKDIIRTLIERLKLMNTSVSNTENNPSKTYLMVGNQSDLEAFKDVKDILDFKFEVFKLGLNGDCFQYVIGTNPIILIDNYPIQSFMLMGWMYAKNIKYRTASLRGFGSNVMIAASSSGHMQLPAFTDDTYRKDMH
jgi:nucleoside 2-deoxyribosyltransferase